MGVIIPPILITDADALHISIPGEINGLASKAAPVAADNMLIEDSQDLFKKKKITVSNFVANDPTVQLNSTHRLGDGSDHADVATNTTHSTGNGSDHADVASNTTHRTGNGSDHANVALNDTHRLGNGSDHANVALNDTHRTGSGADHSDVALNNTHRSSDGTDHSDVVLNNAHRVSTSNPHAVTKAQVGLANVTDDAQLKRAAADIDSFAAKTTPVDADIILIEDSADSFNKKKVTRDNFLRVFGTEYNHSESLALQTTSSTAPVNFFSFTTGTLPAGTYIMQMNYIWDYNFATRQPFLALTDSGGAIETFFSFPIAAGLNAHRYSIIWQRVLASGTYTVDLNVNAANVADILSVAFIRFDMWRVA